MERWGGKPATRVRLLPLQSPVATVMTGRPIEDLLEERTKTPERASPALTPSLHRRGQPAPRPLVWLAAFGAMPILRFGYRLHANCSESAPADWSEQIDPTAADCSDQLIRGRMLAPPEA
jgi:hypothetical protein